jgi:acetyl esterase/lipase
VHGGGLLSGDKANDFYGPVCEPFTAAGFACASVNYRLFPDVKWPAPVQDVAASVRYLKDEAARAGAPLERIVVFGHSSGGTIVGALGTDERYLRAEGLSLSDLAGVVVMGCRVKDEVSYPPSVSEDEILRHFRENPYDHGFGSLRVLNDAVPWRHVTDKTPPFLILVGEREQYHDEMIADARAFARKMERKGRRSTLVVLPGATHGSEVADLAKEKNIGFEAIVSFVSGEGAR